MSPASTPLEAECSYSEHPRGSAEWLQDVNAVIRGDRRYAEGLDLLERYEMLRVVAMDLASEMRWARKVAKKMLHIARARGPEPFGLTMAPWILEPLL